MRRRVFLSLAAASVVAGCGGFRQSRINPRNWFGRSRSRRVAEMSAENTNPLIPQQEDSIFRRRRTEVYAGTPVDQISEMVIERTSDGAIIRVTGLPLRQGAYDVRLIPENKDGKPENGALVYRLMAVQSDTMPQGQPRMREVRAAAFVSAPKLERTDIIRVVGARNEQVSRR
ncbi:hypothetical protein SAMN05443999_101605 [Roseovarius azorensis]|uniref:Lipoprotein n=1 Tax=Roseovarius azorensis TaxID=1287727 RepID=A0A1H7HU29_9RHOB|nr:hypothetical protein [Roseovarius azorensis]SEK53072.1 hypothetical protein SAMN05443999_101605 [Roseovarius azorensis]